MKLENYSEAMTLKNGSPILIRSLKQTDGPSLQAFFRSLPEEDRLFLDDDVTAPSFMDRYLASADFETTIPLVAEHEGKIVGAGSLKRPRYGWMSHVGTIRVVVARAMQRRGVAQRLVKALSGIAVNLGLDKMVAEVAETQAGARRAFERLGFKAEATLKGHIRDLYGRPRDMVIMANDVTHLWESYRDLAEEFLPPVE